MKSNERFDRVEEKLDQVITRISSIDVTLAKQHVSLEEHIRRTALLEKQMEPVQRHVNMVSGAFKLVGFISIIVGTVFSIAKLLGKV